MGPQGIRGMRVARRGAGVHGRAADLNPGGGVFDANSLDEIYRREAGRCLATLVRVLGDIDLAEDALADAFALAAQRWPRDGMPPNPGGWITTTARNRAIDHLRRESTRTQRHIAALTLLGGESAVTDDFGDLDVVPDDQLRLIFLCCHPALGADAQVALTLRLLGGLETREIARAFLVAETTMAQQLVRAKRKIRDLDDGEPADLLLRLGVGPIGHGHLAAGGLHDGR